MKRIGILTSGGDSPGMNAAIRAVVRTAIYNGIQPYGIKRGYSGLINGEIEIMNNTSVADIIQRGGTILLTARSKEFLTEEGFHKALLMLESFKIEGLIVIGGDGSMRGAKELSDAGIPTIVLPGTIDNDLPYTDYTIGFDTAVNTALWAIGNLRDTSSSHGRVNIVQLMGRHCGDISLLAGIGGGAEAILVPEEEYDLMELCQKILEGKNRGKRHCIIILSEGVKIGPEELAVVIEKHTGMESRISVLGHVQRGGAPTSSDRILASRLGYHAVKALIEGRAGRAIGVNGDEIIEMSINEALEAKRPRKDELIELAKILSV